MRWSSSAKIGFLAGFVLLQMLQAMLSSASVVLFPSCNFGVNAISCDLKLLQKWVFLFLKDFSASKMVKHCGQIFSVSAERLTTSIFSILSSSAAVTDVEVGGGEGAVPLMEVLEAFPEGTELEADLRADVSELEIHSTRDGEDVECNDTGEAPVERTPVEAALCVDVSFENLSRGDGEDELKDRGGGSDETTPGEAVLCLEKPKRSTKRRNTETPAGPPPKIPHFTCPICPFSNNPSKYNTEEQLHGHMAVSHFLNWILPLS